MLWSELFNDGHEPSDNQTKFGAAYKSLAIDVKNENILYDVKELIALRVNSL